MVANTTSTKRLTTPQTMQKDKSSFQSHWFISETPPSLQHFLLEFQSRTLGTEFHYHNRVFSARSMPQDRRVGPGINSSNKVHKH